MRSNNFNPGSQTAVRDAQAAFWSATPASIDASAFAFRAEDKSASEALASTPSLGKPKKRSSHANHGSHSPHHGARRSNAHTAGRDESVSANQSSEQVARESDVLFVIDTVPYKTKLAQLNAQLAYARARLNHAVRERERIEAVPLNAYSIHLVSRDLLVAQVAVDKALDLVRNARAELLHNRITVPFVIKKFPLPSAAGSFHPVGRSIAIRRRS